AIAGLVGLTAWTALSERWAPLADPARQDTERLLLYTGALVAAAAILRGRDSLRRAEKIVAAGAFVVVGYGLSERLLPGLITLHHDPSAGGRLEQPLTYWN